MEVPVTGKTATRREPDNPLVCNLNLLTESDRARLASLAVEVIKATEQMRPLARGYSCNLKSDPDILRKLAEWIPLEQACCSFLQFQVTVEAGGAAIILDITGPEGTTAFLEQEIGMVTSLLQHSPQSRSS